VNIFGHLANVSELKEPPFYKLKNLWKILQLNTA